MTDYLTVLAWRQRSRAAGSSSLTNHTDLIEEVAALWESLSQNHAFIDGNKRTAFAALYTFLAINGARITADAEETFEFADALYEANQFTFEKIVCWLRHAVAQSPRISDAE